MKKHIHSHALVITLCTILLCIANIVSAQQNDALLKKLTVLRDSYVDEIKSFGYQPSLAAPVLVLDNPRSFGNYDDDSNVLHSSDWNTSPEQIHQIFTSLAQGVQPKLSGEHFFDIAVHKWIFVHELAHWWRACEHVTADAYENEKAANRIAAAYWNEHDPKFYHLMVGYFKGYVEHVPSPVPSGQDKAQYLKDHYNDLPGGEAYSWYQAIMIVEVSKEQPFETFKQAVKHAGKPLQ